MDVKMSYIKLNMYSISHEGEKYKANIVFKIFPEFMSSIPDDKDFYFPEDKKAALKIKERLEGKNSEWGWCIIKCETEVTINDKTFKGSDQLRCASYDGWEDFLESGDAESMVESAMVDSFIYGGKVSTFVVAEDITRDIFNNKLVLKK